jgi:hypothetical protein
MEVVEEYDLATRLLISRKRKFNRGIGGIVGGSSGGSGGGDWVLEVGDDDADTKNRNITLHEGTCLLLMMTLVTCYKYQ